MSDEGQALRLLVLPGDGIGREVIPAAVAVLRATGLPLELSEGEAGWECFQRHGAALPNETLAAARAAQAVLFGAVASPSFPVPGYRSPIVALRRALDLYANIRPVATDQRPKTDDQQTAAGEQGADREDTTFVLRPSSPVDLVVVRENTECLYTGQEQSDGETATATRVITRRASERIARVAFELARARARQTGRGPRVTVVHKANVLRETCGLFRTSALRVAEQYPDVAVDELLVDNAALQLVQRPQRFDVLVTTNMFGDILSDVASYWGGGLGLASSSNFGDQHALFEPVHGAAPDIVGKGVANPLAAIGCVAMLLEHLGRPTASDQRPTTNDQRSEAYLAWAGRIRAAMRAVQRGPVRTPDQGGAASTEDVTRAVIDALG
jgi:homoisocitrate dehydrogenase